MPEAYQEQDARTVFALDIGTRSIIGVVGRAENGRLRVLAVEQENHGQRAMLDGQIEDIDRVAAVAQEVVRRLEEKLSIRMKKVCVAAAGRALQSERAQFTLEFAAPRQMDDELIGQLETGAVSAAERALMEKPDQHDRFYMVGYTVGQYRLDGYPMSALRGHSGKRAEADVVATFLPREVVDSLYAVVGKLGLEVASLTLEPIASLNAAIPADIRLLNLALVDVGAGTSDIAVCRDGSVTGYTMSTVAGDEVTELLMRTLLVDFQTGERLKAELTQDGQLSYMDILGITHEISAEELRETVRPVARVLAKDVSARIIDLNGGKAPSAVFLAGGGSKLAGLRQCVAEELSMDPARVALAGNHFEKSTFSGEYDLKDPEYATPLGIAVSAALGLINDSYVVTLNGEPAKLFRSGTLVLRDILLMNGFHYGDLMGRSGANLTITLNGERQFFRGAAATPPGVSLNGQPAELSALVHAGDSIRFTPAKVGADACRTVAELVGQGFEGTVTVNGAVAAPGDVLHTGDVVWISQPDPPAAAEPPPAPEPPDAPRPKAVTPAESKAEEPPAPAGRGLIIMLNDEPLALPGKPGGEPYYLMDVLEHSGLDFDKLDKPVELLVNGVPGQFSQRLADNDRVSIQCG